MFTHMSVTKDGEDFKQVNKIPAPQLNGAGQAVADGAGSVAEALDWHKRGCLVPCRSGETVAQEIKRPAVAKRYGAFLDRGLKKTPHRCQSGLLIRTNKD
jgi:hypothetical protein